MRLLVVDLQGLPQFGLLEYDILLDLDDLLLGTGFKAFALPGRIEIRRPDETGRAG